MIGMNPDVFKDYRGNWYSKCSLSTFQICKLVLEFWHFRRRYFCDGLFRVPIPVVIEDKVVFETRIGKYTDKVFLINPEIEISPLDDKNQIIEKYGEVKYYPKHARFADIIVAREDWLHAENRFVGHKYEVINFHALPIENVPPYLLEMIDNLLRRPKDYTYSLTDWIQSTTFWSHHCFVRSV